jgi:hypothetical protein
MAHGRPCLNTTETFAMRKLFDVLVALGLLLSLAGQASAGFTLITEQTALNANDTADWNSSGLLTSKVNGGSVRWSETDHSNPDFDTLVNNNPFGRTGLFIGTAVEPGRGPDTAFYDLNMSFDFHGLAVLGVGAQVYGSIGGPGGVANITAYDIDGNSQTFDISNGYNTSSPKFLGVLSDRPLARLEIFDSHTGDNVVSTLNISPLEFDVVVPTPPSLELAGVAILCVGVYGLLRKRSAACLAEVPTE